MPLPKSSNISRSEPSAGTIRALLVADAFARVFVVQAMREFNGQPNDLEQARLQLIAALEAL